MADEIQISLIRQQTAVVEQLLNEILDSVIAVASQGQVPTEELLPATEAVPSARISTAGTRPADSAAATAAELYALQHASTAACLAQSSMSLLKERVDQSCDGAFGIECLEAEGPADSWLVEAAEMQAATDASRIFCKGPSWDGFVEKMAGKPVAKSADGVTAEERPAAAEPADGVVLSAVEPAATKSQQTAAILTAYEQTQAAVLQGSSSKCLLAAVAEDAAAHAATAGQRVVTASNEALHEASAEVAVSSRASSRRSSLNGSISPGCSSSGSGKAAARLSSARISLRNSTDRLASGPGVLSCSSSIDSKAAAAATSIERMPPGGSISISRSNSLAGNAAGVASPGASLRRSTGSLPFSAGMSRSSSLKAAELRSSVDCFPFTAAGGSSCARFSSTGGNSSTERLPSGAGARESEAWMVSLRSVSRSSSSGGKAPTSSDSQRRLTSSSSTPARPSTAGRISHSTSNAGNSTPTTPASRTSTAGKPTRSASAKTSVPATPTSSSRATAAGTAAGTPSSAGRAAVGTPSSAAKAGGTPVCRSSTSKYSLRGSRPNTPVAASNPTSPVMSPRRTVSMAGSSSSDAKGVAVTSPRRGFTGAGSTSASSSSRSRKVSEASPCAYSSFNQRHTVAAAGASSSSACPHTASADGAHPRASLNLKDARAAAAAAAPVATAAVQSGVARDNSTTRVAAIAITPAVAAAAAAATYESMPVQPTASVADAAGSRTAGSISPLNMSPRTSDEQKEQLWTSDAAAVQLFMDEYKEVLQAIDNAFSSDQVASQVAATGALQGVPCDAEAAAEHSAAAAAATEDGLASIAADGTTTVADTVDIRGSLAGSAEHQQQQVDALEKKLELELGLRAASSSADADYTIAAVTMGDQSNATNHDTAAGKLGKQAEKEKNSAGAKATAAAVADEVVFAEVEVAAACAIMDGSKWSQAGAAAAAAASNIAHAADVTDCSPASQQQDTTAADDVKVPKFGCFACFRRPKAKA